MPNTGHYTICPYYKDEKNNSISCIDVFHRFRWRSQKLKWMEEYCDCYNWENCPYAKELTEVYDRVLEKGADMEVEMMKHRIEALEKENKRLVSMLGRTEKRDQEKAGDIKRLKDRNDKLVRHNREIRSALDQTKADGIKAAKQVINVANMYEGFIAYLLSEFKDGKMSMSDYEAWGKEREFRLIASKRDPEGKPLEFIADVKEVKHGSKVSKKK